MQGNASTIATTIATYLLLVVSAAHVDAQPPSSTELEATADTLMNREDFSGALRIYDQLLTKKYAADRQVDLLYKRAVCLYSLERFDEAITDIDQVIEAFPLSRQALLLRTFISRELDDVPGQLAYLERLLEIDPINTQLIKWRASLLIGEDRYLEARSQLKYANSIQADEETELYLGLTYYYEGDKDSALVHMDNAIRLNPTYLPAYLYAGSLSLEESVPELALSYLDVVLQLDPKNSSALLYKGVALTDLERLPEACECLSRAFYAGEDDASQYLVQYCFR